MNVSLSNFLLQEFSKSQILKISRMANSTSLLPDSLEINFNCSFREGFWMILFHDIDILRGFGIKKSFNPRFKAMKQYLQF